MAIQSVHYEGKGFTVTRRVKVGAGGLIPYGACEIDTSDPSGNTVVQASAATTALNYAGIGQNSRAVSEGGWIDLAVPVRGVVAYATAGTAFNAGSTVELVGDGKVDDTTGGVAIGIALETADDADDIVKVFLVTP